MKGCLIFSLQNIIIGADIVSDDVVSGDVGACVTVELRESST